MWHIDTTVIRLLDGTRAYLHAVIDNFSRRILAWRVAETFAPVNSVAVLVEASRGATRSDTTPVVLADAGVENVNAEVDDLITTGVLRRVLAFTERKFSNSMIEAWWRSLKHQWLFLHSLDSVTTVRRLVAFYVDQHNRVLPHSAFHGQTPNEMYFGTGDVVPADLRSRGAVRTDIRHFPARVVVTSEDALHRPRGLEQREGTVDDHAHADHGSLAAALRPPASESRPTHRRRDRRHGPRSPPLDGACVAPRDADSGGRSGCPGPH